MKTGTAILLAAVGLAVVVVVLRKRQEPAKPSGAAAAVDLVKWGYNEIWGDDE